MTTAQMIVWGFVMLALGLVGGWQWRGVYDRFVEGRDNAR